MVNFLREHSHGIVDLRAHDEQHIRPEELVFLLDRLMMTLVSGLEGVSLGISGGDDGSADCGESDCGGGKSGVPWASERRSRSSCAAGSAHR